MTEVPPTADAPSTAAPADAAGNTDESRAAFVEALVESRQRYRDIVEISGDFAWETDAAGRFTFVSSGERFASAPDDMVDAPAARFLMDGGTASRETPFHARKPVRDVDVWMRAGDGKAKCLMTSATPRTDAAGNWAGARGICRDVTEIRRRDAAFAALQRREALMARILREVSNELDPDSMLATALEESLNAFSAAYADIRLTDDGRAFAIRASAGEEDFGAPVLATVYARLAETGTMVTAADGDRHYLCAPTQYRGTVTGAIMLARRLADGSWSDEERTLATDFAAQIALLIQQLEFHERLEAMARTDELTGLLNRRAFHDELADRVARLGTRGAAGALFYVDLDNFKAVNDVHGHQRGDEALRRVADLLTTRTRGGDLVARLGGDEFAMWLERTDAEAAVARAADLIEAGAGLRIYSGTPEAPLGLSVGVAVYRPGSAEAIDNLTARADGAMYAVKRAGKGSYRLADAAADGERGKTDHDDPDAGGDGLAATA